MTERPSSSGCEGLLYDSRHMLRNRSIACLVFLSATFLLAGCWTPPVATVHPRSPPGLIQAGVFVESVLGPAIVRSVNPSARTIVLQVMGTASARTYRVGRAVAGFDRITPGEMAHAIVLERLTVYVSNGLPAAEGAYDTVMSGTKVLSVDTSYRLLTLQYAAGQNETFKVGAEVDLKRMQAGDDVAIEPLEVVALAVRRPWWR